MTEHSRGMLSIEELARLVGGDEIETVVVGFTDHYGRLNGKRYDAEFFVEEIAGHGTHGCDYLLTTDMEMEPVPGYRFANWELGYGDMHLVPDMATLRRASWLDRTALVLCDVEAVSVAPRSVLRAQVDAAGAAGLTAMAATELEYYLYGTSYRDAAAAGYRDRDLEPAGWYLEDYQLLQGTRTESFTAAVRRHLKHSGVPVENSKGEWGLGQHELNVRYADAIEMADRHVVYKQCVKEVAEQQGASVTFMAKVAADKAGSSCHIHMSLWRDGANVFAGENGSSEGSDEFRWFLGGCLSRVPDVMVFLAPTVNSYKRYVDASWAPTRIAWSVDNRTAGFRVVGSDQSLRVECRIPGADCNPYLALAAVLAAGLDGIANQTEPPDKFVGDVYAARDLPHVPRTLRDAVDLFEASAFAKAAFGEDVVEHYAHFFRTEQSAYDTAVTDWERQRYFERI
jgi:glutamine synthetase